MNVTRFIVLRWSLTRGVCLALMSGLLGAAPLPGEALYNARCYYCHGYSGDGRTVAASYLTPPPRDFTAPGARNLARDDMIASVRDGRPGTAMKSFKTLLSEAEMATVVDYIRQAFIERQGQPTRYHIPENGWNDHARYRDAYPFVRGEIPLDRSTESLSASQRAGRALFLAACTTCHDPNPHPGTAPKLAWEGRPISYPRNHYIVGQAGSGPPVDAVTSASPYAQHDRPPRLTGLTAVEKRGGALFQKNCAFCHGADGTGKNWIGSFMTPHPRNLTDPQSMAAMTTARLTQVIETGLPETSMPAWGSVLSRAEIRAVVAYVSRAFHPCPSAPKTVEQCLAEQR